MIQPWHPDTQDSVQAVGSGNLVMVPVEIFQTSAMIAKGHSLRVAVGASDLLQGVLPVPTLLQQLAGVLTIHCDAEHSSSVVLAAVPVSELQSRCSIARSEERRLGHDGACTICFSWSLHTEQ